MEGVDERRLVVKKSKYSGPCQGHQCFLPKLGCIGVGCMLPVELVGCLLQQTCILQPLYQLEECNGSCDASIGLLSWWCHWFASLPRLAVIHFLIGLHQKSERGLLHYQKPEMVPAFWCPHPEVVDL